MIYKFIDVETLKRYWDSTKDFLFIANPITISCDLIEEVDELPDGRYVLIYDNYSFERFLEEQEKINLYDLADDFAIMAGYCYRLDSYILKNTDWWRDGIKELAEKYNNWENEVKRREVPEKIKYEIILGSKPLRGEILRINDLFIINGEYAVKDVLDSKEALLKYCKKVFEKEPRHINIFCNDIEEVELI